MFTTNLKRSAAALALTAGLLTAAAPASHASSYELNDALITSYTFNDVLISSYDVKAKPAKAVKAKKGKKGKKGRGNVTAAYDIRTDRTT